MAMSKGVFKQLPHPYRHDIGAGAPTAHPTYKQRVQKRDYQKKVHRKRKRIKKLNVTCLDPSIYYHEPNVLPTHHILEVS